MSGSPVIVIFGKRGSGKSRFTKRYLAGIERAFIFDPLSEYHNTFVAENFLELTAYMKINHSKSFRVACRFAGVDKTEEEVDREYQFAARLAWEIGNLMLVIDECELYLNSSERYQDSNFLNRIISLGRHRNIGILAIGRRPTEVPIRLRSVATTIVCFQFDEPSNLAYLERWGLPVEAIASLKLHEPYVHGENIFRQNTGIEV